MSIIAACCQGSRPPNASASNRLRSTMPGRFKPCAISRMRRSSARWGSLSTPARSNAAPLRRSSTSFANKISRSSFCKMRLMGIDPSLISARNAARRSESLCELATEVASRSASTVGNRSEFVGSSSEASLVRRRIASASSGRARSKRPEISMSRQDRGEPTRINCSR